MSEMAPEFLRLAIYKETSQANIIPSYFPPNFTRTAPSLKSVFKEAQKRQPKSYIIEQVLELTPKPNKCPEMVEHNYKDKDKPHTLDQKMYENNLANLNHFSNQKWHFMLEPDFTNVLCDARYIKFEKIEINLIDEELDELRKQYEMYRDMIVHYDMLVLEHYEEYREEFIQYYIQIEHPFPEPLPDVP
jgi:hypothetical protein